MNSVESKKNKFESITTSGKSQTPSGWECVSMLCCSANNDVIVDEDQQEFVNPVVTPDNISSHKTKSFNSRTKPENKIKPVSESEQENSSSSDSIDMNL